MDNEAQPKKSPRDLLRIISRRWSLFLLGASLCAIVILLSAHWYPERKYTGVAKFTRRIDPAAEQLVASKSESFETRKLTLLNDLAGDKAIEKVIEGMGLMRNLPRTSGGVLTAASEMAKQELVRKIKAETKVDWEVKSDQVDLIAVTFTDAVRELAQNVPNAFVSNYIGWVSQQIIERLKASEEFLKDAKDKCQHQLDTIIAQKITFETKHAGAMPQSPGVLDEQIRSTRRDLDTLRRLMSIADAKFKLLNERSSPAAASEPSPATSPATSPSSAPARAFVSAECERVKVQLREANDLLATMQTIRKMTDKHPEVLAQKSRIKQLEAEVARLESEPADPVTGVRPATGGPVHGPDASVDVAMVAAEIGALKSHETSLTARLEEYQRLQMDYEVVSKDYDSIIRRLKDKEDEMRKWDARHLQVQMDLAAESASKRTQNESILTAQPQFRPSFPTPVMVLAAALLGGLGFGGLLVFLAHALDRTIATSEDAVKCFNVPVYGVIGEIVTDKQRRRRRLRKWILGPCVTVIVVAALGLSALSIELSLHYPEEFAKWRTSPVGYVISLVSGMKF